MKKTIIAVMKIVIATGFLFKLHRLKLIQTKPGAKQ